MLNYKKMEKERKSENSSVNEFSQNELTTKKYNNSNSLNFLSDLSEEQIKAVKYIEGPSIISAGAGSGKTRVLTYKIAYLIKNDYEPCSIMALTFTNKAANEMKERIVNLIDHNAAQQIWMGTFHSIFLKILRYNVNFLKSKYGFQDNFSIFPGDNKNIILEPIIEKYDNDFRELKTKGDKTNEVQNIIMSVSDDISKIKNEGKSLDEYLQNSFLIKNIQNYSNIKNIYNDYVKKCRLLNGMDFDDILVYTLDMLKNSQEILLKYQSLFKFILVDEYQDTNKIQFMIISLLSKKHKKLCVVGDDAQCIYSFRGSRIENILEFKDCFNAKEFKLQKNYRSTENIVECANNLIKKNTEQIHKILSAHNCKKSGNKVKIIECDDYKDEAKQVVEEIQKLKNNNEKYSWNSFAILYRTHKLAEAFETQLKYSGIPYKIIGKIKFLEREIIAHILAYLKIIVNPKDNISILKIINYSPNGNKLKLVFDNADKNGISYWEAIHNMLIYMNKNDYLKEINKIIELITSLKKDYQKLQPIEIIDKIIYFINKNSPQYTNNDEDKILIVKMRSLTSNLTENYKNSIIIPKNDDNEKITEIYPLNEFISDLILLNSFEENDEILENDSESEEYEKNNKVKLMTIHCSKGLEFSNVFIVGVENGYYPLFNKNKLDNFSKQKHEEEERRTFYVALTRAKENCYISYAMKRLVGSGKLMPRTKSPFISDLEEESNYVEYIKKSTINKNNNYVSFKFKDQYNSYKNNENTNNSHYKKNKYFNYNNNFIGKKRNFYHK